ncbi:hypothetical protein NFI96_009346 [Prochilodus magdalenae]|nr:hypothetical protein NFI96_009346 [Prochilodus magdalenae]
MEGFKISTLNVDGARDGVKRAKVFELVKQKRLDVVLLQETNSDVNNSADWIKEWEGLAVLSHHTSMSGGVAVLFAKSFIPCSYDVEEVVTGRLLKWWDMAKIQTSIFCQRYSLNVMRDITRSLKALEMEIVELQNLGVTTGNREHIKTLQKRKTATLADLLGARVQGALVRSRFQSASEMEVKPCQGVRGSPIGVRGSPIGAC